MLAAGERTIRFYPGRFDIEPSAIDEALAILRAAIDDVVGGRATADAAQPVRIHVGTLAIPLETVEVVELTPATFEPLKQQIFAVEQERYGAASYPPDVLRAGARPLLQYPVETFETTIANPHAVGVALRDRVSGRLIGFGIGSALENHDEEGVTLDPHFGENNTFYLQATATLPSLQNDVEIENRLLDVLRARARTEGFEFISTLIEERILESGPAWLRAVPPVTRIDNYLRGGQAFVYVEAAVTDGPASS